MTTDGQNDVQNGNREKVEEQGKASEKMERRYRGHGRKDVDEKDERQREWRRLSEGYVLQWTDNAYKY